MSAQLGGKFHNPKMISFCYSKMYQKNNLAGKLTHTGMKTDIVLARDFTFIKFASEGLKTYNKNHFQREDDAQRKGLLWIVLPLIWKHLSN